LLDLVLLFPVQAWVGVDSDKRHLGADKVAVREDVLWLKMLHLRMARDTINLRGPGKRRTALASTGKVVIALAVTETAADGGAGKIAHGALQEFGAPQRRVYLHNLPRLKFIHLC
jgi:hypothetical protein